jgi:hypothetical protein
VGMSVTGQTGRTAGGGGDYFQVKSWGGGVGKNVTAQLILEQREYFVLKF